MLDLILPNVQNIIKSTMKLDTGNDCNIKLIGHTNDYDLYINSETGSRYLVQCSHKYDVFGFQNYKESFPEVDTYIYIGIRFIFIHFAEALIKNFKTSGRSRNTMWDGTPDDTQLWTPSFLLFNDIGGILYDYQDRVLVDKLVDRRI